MKYSIQYLLADNYRYLETRSLTRWQDPGWGRVLEPTVTSSQSWLWPTLRKPVPPSYYKSLCCIPYVRLFVSTCQREYM